MKILAIESSCDETSAAVVVDAILPNERILSNVIVSQIETHQKYGGVVPEYAARNHIDCIDKIILQALNDAKLSLNDIDCIAATAGPGLIGGLLVGTVTAKTMAVMSGKPFFAVNHLEAHLLTPRLCFDVEFPYLLLLASGGNFIFAEIFGIGNYKILGETLDDAAGEAFDKVAKMLNFPYPGGPSIEKYAKMGDKNRFKYSVPMQKNSGCDVSFSGLKTATKMHIESIKNITAQDKYDVAASFQHIVSVFITRQLRKAYKMTTSNIQNIVFSGGVASNLYLRNMLNNTLNENNLNFYAPPINLCSDNAAMIGWAAIENIKNGAQNSSLSSKTNPRWPITDIAYDKIKDNC